MQSSWSIVVMGLALYLGIERQCPILLEQIMVKKSPKTPSFFLTPADIWWYDSAGRLALATNLGLGTLYFQIWPCGGSPLRVRSIMMNLEKILKLMKGRIAKVCFGWHRLFHHMFDIAL